ncbi:MAG: hypothetical protein JWO32_1041 [Bacteroidetes bacterium]|nr:hypothetical protein [Bacteroidota bacterium]
MPKSIKIKSVVVCPVCKFKRELFMAANHFLKVYECEECNALLKTDKKQCCIFCSYGSVPCIPVQMEKKT